MVNEKEDLNIDNFEYLIKKAYESGMLRTHQNSEDYYNDLYNTNILVTYSDIVEKCGWSSFCNETGIDKNYYNIFETSSDETFTISKKSAIKLKLYM